MSTDKRARPLPPDVNPETLCRLSPIRREALSEEQQKVYDALARPPSGGLNLAGLRGPGGIFVRYPGLSRHIGPMNRILRSELGLDPKLVEIAILATAREMKSQFEWTMHEPVALTLGIPEATVDAIKQRLATTGLPEKEAVLIELARESVGDKKVTPGTYARALQAFGEQGVLDYTALISVYAMTAIVLSVFDMQLHDGQKPLLPEELP
jgi:4-carboxymuconolactone decarboxylase